MASTILTTYFNDLAYVIDKTYSNICADNCAVELGNNTSGVSSYYACVVCENETDHKNYHCNDMITCIAGLRNPGNISCTFSANTMLSKPIDSNGVIQAGCPDVCNYTRDGQLVKGSLPVKSNFTCTITLSCAEKRQLSNAKYSMICGDIPNGYYSGQKFNVCYPTQQFRYNFTSGNTTVARETIPLSKSCDVANISDLDSSIVCLVNRNGLSGNSKDLEYCVYPKNIYNGTCFPAGFYNCPHIGLVNVAAYNPTKSCTVSYIEGTTAANSCAGCCQVKVTVPKGYYSAADTCTTNLTSNINIAFNASGSVVTSGYKASGIRWSWVCCYSTLPGGMTNNACCKFNASNPGSPSYCTSISPLCTYTGVIFDCGYYDYPHVGYISLASASPFTSTALLSGCKGYNCNGCLISGSFTPFVCTIPFAKYCNDGNQTNTTTEQCCSYSVELPKSQRYCITVTSGQRCRTDQVYWYLYVTSDSSTHDEPETEITGRYLGTSTPTQYYESPVLNAWPDSYRNVQSKTVYYVCKSRIFTVCNKITNWNGSQPGPWFSSLTITAIPS